MTAWIVAVALMLIIGGAVVVDEIRDDLAWRRYGRQRDERIREIFLRLPPR